MRLGACNRLLSITLAAVMMLAALRSAAAEATEPVVVYSARNEQLIKPIFDRFTAEVRRNIKLFC